MALLSALLFSMPSHAAPAKVTRFPTIAQCVAKGHFPDEDCKQAFEAALRLYSDRVPRFSSREQCNKHYMTCVVYLPYPAPQRLDPKKLNYAPPFLGISKTSDSVDLLSISILIGMEQFGMKARVTAKLRPPTPATRHFEPTPEMLARADQKRQVQSQADPDDVIVIDGALFSEPLPGQVLTYPVPQHLLPKRIPSVR